MGSSSLRKEQTAAVDALHFRNDLELSMVSQREPAGYCARFKRQRRRVAEQRALKIDRELEGSNLCSGLSEGLSPFPRAVLSDFTTAILTAR